VTSLLAPAALSLRKVAVGLLLGAGAAAIVLLLGVSGWLETAELKTYDWRMRRSVMHPPSVNNDIVFVEIDDTTVRDLEPVFGRFPWPRVAFSVLIDYLNRGPAKVVALDFTFIEEQRNVNFKIGGDQGESWTGEESDAALVDAVRKGNVVLLADAVYQGTDTGHQLNKPPEWSSPFRKLGPSIEQRPIVVPSFQALSDSARALGHNYAILDPDGVVRRTLPFIRVGDRYMPSLGMATALAAGGFNADEVVLEGDVLRVRDRRIPLVPVEVPNAPNSTDTHDQLTMLVNYRAPLVVDGKRPYEWYEARKLLSPRVRSWTAPWLRQIPTSSWTLQSSRTRSSSSGRRCPAWWMYFRRPLDRRCPGCWRMPASPRACSRIVSYVGPVIAPGPRSRLWARRWLV
jgi:CHASE2 domain-containing sensor protein